ncbi:MAG: YfjI family protein [Pseudomonadota bacterium]|nr:YfjI family protein [Pseudomonadota bacterium]
MNARDAYRSAPAHDRPAPTPLLRATPPASAYPVEALGPLRAAAEAIHDKTQAPFAIGAQSVLGVASLAAQGLVNAETLHGPAPASLFLLTLAESGERKTASDRLAMRAIHDFEAELRAASALDAARHANRMAIWEAERKRILGSAKGGGSAVGSTATQADLDELGPSPEPPLYPVILAGEPTIEGVTRHMGLLRPALGLFSDEGGGFLGGHAMTSENKLKTISGLSRFWDGAVIDRWRAGDGVQTFAGRRLAAHLMAQPVVASGLLADPMANGQGFLARFLMAAPPSAIGFRDRIGHDPASDRALADFEAQTGDLLRRDLPLRDGSRNELQPPMLPLSPEARAVLQDFGLQVERAQAPGGALETSRAFASKAAEHAARVAAVLAVYLGEAAVSGETMADAVTLAGHYIGEAKRLGDAAVISTETAEAERLRRWLAESWPEPFVSVADVTQRGPSSLREAARARRLMKVLEANNWLTPVPEGATILGKFRREVWNVYRESVS